MPKPRPMAVLIPAAILDFIGFAILVPILPLYAEEMGANKWQLMLVMGSYSLIQFFAAPWLGRLSDRLGRKPVLLLCYAGSFLSYLVFGAARTIPVILVSRVINGLTGGNIPLAQAVVADVMPGDSRTRGMGLIGMSLGIGFILGPAGGAIMYKMTGHVGPPLLAAALSFLSILITWIWLPESSGPREVSAGHTRFSLGHLREAFRYPFLATVLLITLLSGVAFSTFESTFSQFLQHRYRYGPGDVGPVFALIGIVIAVVQGGLIGPLARRYGEGRMVGLGILSMVVALVALPLTPGLGWLFLVLGIYSFGGGVLSPSTSSLVPAACPPERIGAMLGTYQAMTSLGRIIGPVWGQFAHGTFSEAFPYQSAAVLMALALLLGLRRVVFSRHRPASPA